MQRTNLLLSAVCAAMLSLASGCAAMKMPAPSLPGMGNASAPAGTPEWWKAHKKKAVFEGPGKGWSVAGYPGYFDDQGRPINMKVAKVVDKKDDGGGLLGDAGFKDRVSGIKESVGLGPDQQQAQADFAEAEDLFRHEKYSEAAKAYKRAAAGWPDSQLEQDAMFKMSESYFFAARYSKANNGYEKLIRKYPNSTYLDNIITRQFSIARYWEQYHDYNPDWVMTPNLINKTRPLFDTIGRSMKVYENIRLNDPTGPWADDAVMATANSYFRRGRYNDADFQYDLLRKEYPRSQHQFEAHILGLQCKLRKYQGPSYDGKPLDEAKLLVKQLKIQFSGELDQEQRQRLVEVDGQLNRQLAQREFNMGEHFDNLEEYGSAKFYYAELIKEYPDSQLAATARERLAAIGGLPERPSSIFDPALEYLPENAERRAIAEVPMVKDPGTNVPLLDEGQTRMAGATEEDAAGNVEQIRR
jgi:TolA-binding protein